MGHRNVLTIATTALLAVASACSGDAVSRQDADVVAPPVAGDSLPQFADVLPPITADDVLVSTPAAVSTSTGALVAVDGDGDLALIRSDGSVDAATADWDTLVSLDESYAVSTVLVGPGDTKVAWSSLPDGTTTAGRVFEGEDLEATATELHGLPTTAFVNRAEASTDGAIAGARETSTIVLAQPDRGEVFRTELAGNYVPEAFATATNGNGLPIGIFLIEYVPASTPEWYRVRVLSTDTGELSPPVNLRDKTEFLDEQMAGTSRTAVVAAEQSLLFTLYRGTSDGTPDGEPYAFIHTLGFANGVWCLGIDPELELERRSGAMATAGDRLYVASANGALGIFDIDDILDPNRIPEMSFVGRITLDVDISPTITADRDGAWVAWGTHLVRIDEDGSIEDQTTLSRAPEAMTNDDGELVTIGGDESSFGPFARPAWLGTITRVVTG